MSDPSFVDSYDPAYGTCDGEEPGNDIARMFEAAVLDGEALDGLLEESRQHEITITDLADERAKKDLPTIEKSGLAEPDTIL
jgi:hypothetical protein